MARTGQLATLVVTVVVLGSIAWALNTEASSAHGNIAYSDGQRYNTLFPSGQGALGPCSVCHRISAEGPERSAPPLVGIVDADKASSHWFGYSPALARATGTWSVDEIDAYLADPVAFLPGTTKTLSRVRDADERRRVVEALQQLTP